MSEIKEIKKTWFTEIMEAQINISQHLYSKLSWKYKQGLCLL
jgi:hypothetical protein